MARQIALAVKAAHEQGIIHRDLKPGNMMINKQGILKIMDFGLAKKVSEHNEKESKVSGTPKYMAPEQFTGSALDQRTDIYAMGVIFYLLFTGKAPFRASTFREWARVHTFEDIPSVRPVNSRLPESLDVIIHKALQKDAKKRYESVQEMIVDLEKLEH